MGSASSGPRPIFLFSLPRSGSTWVQRVLSQHPQISTVAEPWFLLPVLSADRPRAAAADYGHATLVEAMEGLYESLPAGKRDYYDAVSSFAGVIYERLAQGREYFLDKTPRYHLIARQLADCFPDARFIFLWRNPLATVGSRLHSYGNVWRGYNWHIDFYQGLHELVECSRLLSGSAYSAGFEALVEAPEAGFSALFEWLGLEFDSSYIEDLRKVQIEGRVGDRTGAKKYDRVSTEPLTKWQKTMSSPVRKAWCRRYLRWIGRERLRLMGYDFDLLQAQVEAIPTSWASLPGDAIRFPYSAVRTALSRRVLGFPSRPESA